SFELGPVAILLMLIAATPLYLPKFLWGFPAVEWLIPFLLTVVLVLPFSQLRKYLSWFRVGSTDRISSLLIFLTGVLSALALICWGIWTDNLGYGLSLFQSFRVYPESIVVFVIVPAFALFNAFAEEMVF